MRGGAGAARWGAEATPAPPPPHTHSATRIAHPPLPAPASPQREEVWVGGRAAQGGPGHQQVAVCPGQRHLRPRHRAGGHRRGWLGSRKELWGAGRGCRECTRHGRPDPAQCAAPREPCACPSPQHEPVCVPSWRYRRATCRTATTSSPCSCPTPSAVPPRPSCLSTCPPLMPTWTRPRTRCRCGGVARRLCRLAVWLGGTGGSRSDAQRRAAAVEKQRQRGRLAWRSVDLLPAARKALTTFSAVPRCPSRPLPGAAVRPARVHHPQRCVQEREQRRRAAPQAAGGLLEGAGGAAAAQARLRGPGGDCGWVAAAGWLGRSGRGGGCVRGG